MWASGPSPFSTNSNDAEIDVRKMRIRTKMVANHHHAFALQFRKRLLYSVLFEIRPSKRHGQLGREAGFPRATAQRIDDGFLSAG